MWCANAVVWALALFQAGQSELQALESRARQAVERGDVQAACQLFLRLGDLLLVRGRFEEADAVFQEGLAHTPEDDLRVGLLRGQANACIFSARFPEARKALDEAHRILLERPDPVARCAIEATLGTYYSVLGDYSSAKEHFHEAIRATPTVLGGTPSVGLQLNYGRALLETGETEEARQRLEDALLRFEKDNDATGEARALLSLGDVEFLARRYDDAEIRYGDAEEIARVAGDHVLLLEITVRQCRLARACGEETAVEFLCEETIDAARESDRPEDLLIHLLRLFPFLMSLGADSAREHQQEITELVQIVESPSLRAEAYNALGNYCQVTGAWPAARRFYREAIQLCERLGNDSGRARNLVDLGVSHFVAADDATACRLFEEGRELADRVDDRLARAVAHFSIGLLQARSKDVEAARTSVEQAIQEYSLLNDWESLAGARLFLGECLLLLGEEDKANRLYEEVLAEARQRRASYLEARALGRLAELHSSLGQHERAHESALTSIALFEQFRAAEEILELLDEVALAALHDGNLEEVSILVDRAHGLLSRPSLCSLMTRERSRRRSLFATWDAISQELAFRLSLEAEDPESIAEAHEDGFQHASVWKAPALLEGLLEARLRGSSQRSPEHSGYLELLGLRNETLKEVTHWTPESDSRSPLSARVLDLAAQVETASRKLDDLLADGMKIHHPPSTTVSEVQETLAEGTALVEFAEGTERLVAYVVTKENLERLDLGSKGPIYDQVRRFTSLIESRQTLTPIWRAGQDVHRTLTAPLLGYLGPDVRRLILVPNGALAGLSFAALPIGLKMDKPRPGSFSEVRFLAEDYVVSYVPSSGVLVELSRQESGPLLGKALILGDPTYTSAPAVEQVRSRPCPCGAHWDRPPRGRFFSLPFSRKECVEVAETVLDFYGEMGPEERIAIEDGLKAIEDRLVDEETLHCPAFDLFLGDAATCARLRGDLSGYSLIHLAAHGRADPSSVQLTGIAFAAEVDVDSFLSVDDVLSLQLDAQLVVLSACETAAGEVLQGEGIQSMAWTFLSAGARRVLASIWEVNDAQTFLLMNRFYSSAVMLGKHPALALAEAQREALASARDRDVQRLADGADESFTRDEAAHPFFWAPFLYVGGPN